MVAKGILFCVISRRRAEVCRGFIRVDQRLRGSAGGRRGRERYATTCGIAKNAGAAFSIFLFVSHADAVIEQALRDAQNILWRNLPPTQSQSDEAVVRALRDIVRSARVKSVLERGSDTALVFVLRATNKVLADESETPREIIARLWNILDEPELNRALGIPRTRT